ncbi:MAG: hypothetical protein IJT94_07145 [Oscillibacter sp.]|nr:hypothetical protein [Oscillibacter sp.]
MAQIQETTAQSGVYDPLAAALAKIPQERQGQVRRDAAIFVAGLEAAARTVTGVRPTA